MGYGWDELGALGPALMSVISRITENLISKRLCGISSKLVMGCLTGGSWC